MRLIVRHPCSVFPFSSTTSRWTSILKFNNHPVGYRPSFAAARNSQVLNSGRTRTRHRQSCLSPEGSAPTSEVESTTLAFFVVSVMSRYSRCADERLAKLKCATARLQYFKRRPNSVRLDRGEINQTKIERRPSGTDKWRSSGLYRVVSISLAIATSFRE